MDDDFVTGGVVVPAWVVGFEVDLSDFLLAMSIMFVMTFGGVAIYMLVLRYEARLRSAAVVPSTKKILSDAACRAAGAIVVLLVLASTAIALRPSSTPCEGAFRGESMTR